ncbi:MAG TPA: hypothetical protein VLR93_09560, partial [Patescibacteria group bacterium]|nr:hypothetical protein [Patescibacteria group bacterium]
GFDLADHVEALERHTSSGIVDIVLANNRPMASGAAAVPTAGPVGDAIRLRWPPSVERPPRLVLDDLVDPDEPHHHDPARLAAAIVRIAERDSSARRRGGTVARSA